METTGAHTSVLICSKLFILQIATDFLDAELLPIQYVSKHGGRGGNVDNRGLWPGMGDETHCHQILVDSSVQTKLLPAFLLLPLPSLLRPLHHEPCHLLFATPLPFHILDCKSRKSMTRIEWESRCCLLVNWALLYIYSVTWGKNPDRQKILKQDYAGKHEHSTSVTILLKQVCLWWVNSKSQEKEAHGRQ